MCHDCEFLLFRKLGNHINPESDISFLVPLGTVYLVATDEIRGIGYTAYRVSSVGTGHFEVTVALTGFRNLSGLRTTDN